MISVGPGSPGHGRIVALAALIFMARVAQIRGAAFWWCFLPRTDGSVWFDELSVNTVKRLLKAASYREMTPDDAVEAAQLWEGLTAGPARRDAPELIDWMIGDLGRRPRSPRNAAYWNPDAPTNQLSFTVLAPCPGALRSARLQLRRRGGQATRADISFPDDRVCVSALKTPVPPLRPAAPAARR